jgi:hypothetical protein
MEPDRQRLSGSGSRFKERRGSLAVFLLVLIALVILLLVLTLVLILAALAVLTLVLHGEHLLSRC